MIRMRERWETQRLMNSERAEWIHPMVFLQVMEVYKQLSEECAGCPPMPRTWNEEELEAYDTALCRLREEKDAPEQPASPDDGRGGDTLEPLQLAKSSGPVVGCREDAVQLVWEFDEVIQSAWLTTAQAVLLRKLCPLNHSQVSH